MKRPLRGGYDQDTLLTLMKLLENKYKILFKKKKLTHFVPFFSCRGTDNRNC